MAGNDKELLDAYAVLEVVEGASEGVVRLAFKARALQAHPDKGGSEAEFKRVEAALTAIEAAGFPSRPGSRPTVVRRVCQFCSRSNNVPIGVADVKCGACGERLLWGKRLQQEVAFMADLVGHLLEPYVDFGREESSGAPLTDGDAIGAFQVLRAVARTLADAPDLTRRGSR